MTVATMMAIATATAAVAAMATVMAAIATARVAVAASVTTMAAMAMVWCMPMWDKMLPHITPP